MDRQLLIRGLTIVAVAALVNLGLSELIRGPLGIALRIPLPIPDGPLTDLPKGYIVGLMGLPLSLGTLFLAIARSRGTAGSIRSFGIFGFLFGMATLALPLGLPEMVPDQTKIALASLHVVPIGTWLLLIVVALRR